MTKRLFDAIIRHRIWVLAVSALCVLAVASQAKDLKFILDNDKLLPPNHEYTIGSRLIAAEFGLQYTLVIAASKPTGEISVTDLTAFAALTRQLAQVPGVIHSSVTSLASSKVRRITGHGDSVDVESIYSSGKPLEAIREDLTSDEFFKDILISRDGRDLFILLECSSPSKGFRDIEADILKVVNQYDQFTYRYSGFVPMMAAIEVYSDRVGVLLAMALVVVGGLLYLKTGSIQGAILPVGTGLAAVASTLGLMGFFGVPLDVFNAITPILVLAVVSGHSTQILSTFTTNLRNVCAKDDQALSREVLSQTMVELSPVLLASGLAAAAGFWSLTVFSIQSIWVFGLMAGTAIAIGVLLELIVVPALRACLKAPRSEQGESAFSRILSSICAKANYWVENHRRIILAAYGLTLFLCLALSTGLVVENSNKANVAPGEKIQIDDGYINSRFPGTNTLYVMVDSGTVDGVKQPAFLQVLERIEVVAREEVSVGRAMSYADHIKRIHRVLAPESKQTLPADQATLLDEINFYELGSSQSDFSQFVDADYRKAAVIILMKDDSNKSLTRVVDKIKGLNLEEDGNYELHFGGSVASAAAITEQLIHDKLLNMLQILGVVFVIAAITFRSLVYGFLVILPLVFSVVVNFGLMAAFGIPLNIPTAICAAMAVGLGADYGIYFLMKLRRERAARANEADALAAALSTAGVTCLAVAASIAIGYSVLIFSNSFLPHRWIGILVVSAMLTSAMATITLIPALIRTWGIR